MEPQPTGSQPSHPILPPEIFARALIQSECHNSLSTFPYPPPLAIQDSSLVNNHNHLNTEEKPKLSPFLPIYQTQRTTPPPSLNGETQTSTAGSFQEITLDLGKGQFSWASEKYNESIRKRRISVSATHTTKPYDKVPRPPNAFIIYHQAKSKELAAYKMRPNAEDRHPSKTVAEMWREEPEGVKLRYQREADLALVEHKKKYPFYKYKPQKKDSKNKGRGRDANGSSDSNAHSNLNSSKAEKASQVPFEHRQQAAMESAFTVFELEPLEKTKLNSNNNSSTVTKSETNMLTMMTTTTINNNGAPGSIMNQEAPNMSNDNDNNGSNVHNNTLVCDVNVKNVMKVNADIPNNTNAALWIDSNVNNLYDSPVEEIKQFSFDYTTPLQSPEAEQGQQTTPCYPPPLPQTMMTTQSSSLQQQQQSMTSNYPSSLSTTDLNDNFLNLTLENLLLNQCFEQNFNNAETLFQENSPVQFADDIKPQLGILTPNSSTTTPAMSQQSFLDYVAQLEQSLGSSSINLNLPITTAADFSINDATLLEQSENQKFLALNFTAQAAAGNVASPATTPSLEFPSWRMNLEAVPEPNIISLSSTQHLQETQQQIQHVQEAQFLQDVSLIEATQHQLYATQAQLHQVGQQTQHSPSTNNNIGSVGEMFQSTYPFC